jgi:hypothetical protein
MVYNKFCVAYELTTLAKSIKNKPKLITEKAKMHLMSNPFFSFDLQYDQQIKPRKQQNYSFQYPNERGSLVIPILCQFDYDNCMDHAKP